MWLDSELTWYAFRPSNSLTSNVTFNLWNFKMPKTLRDSVQYSQYQFLWHQNTQILIKPNSSFKTQGPILGIQNRNRVLGWNARTWWFLCDHVLHLGPAQIDAWQAFAWPGNKSWPQVSKKLDAWEVCLAQAPFSSHHPNRPLLLIRACIRMMEQLKFSRNCVNVLYDIISSFFSFSACLDIPIFCVLE